MDALIGAAYASAANEIMTSSTECFGGWLDSPKAVAAAILQLTPDSARRALAEDVLKERIETAKKFHRWIKEETPHSSEDDFVCCAYEADLERQLAELRKGQKGGITNDV